MKTWDKEKSEEIANKILELLEINDRTLQEVDIHIGIKEPIIIRTKELVFFNLIEVNKKIKK